MQVINEIFNLTKTKKKILHSYLIASYYYYCGVTKFTKQVEFPGLFVVTADAPDLNLTRNWTVNVFIRNPLFYMNCSSRNITIDDLYSCNVTIKIAMPIVNILIEWGDVKENLIINGK
jgi:hypothetical protein